MFRKPGVVSSHQQASGPLRWLAANLVLEPEPTSKTGAQSRRRVIILVARTSLKPTSTANARAHAQDRTPRARASAVQTLLSPDLVETCKPHGDAEAKERRPKGSVANPVDDEDRLAFAEPTSLHHTTNRGIKERMKQARQKHELVERALLALDRGELSAEEIVQELVAQSEPSAEWLAQRLSGESAAPRSPHVRTSTAVPDEVARTALEQARQRYGGAPGVVHVHWGVKYTQGHPSPQDGLIFLVNEKRIIARNAPLALPPSLELTWEGQAYSVPTDVRVYARGGSKHGARPGARTGLTAPGGTGTLSAVAHLNGVPYALLSGHVAGAPGKEVRVSTPTGHEFSIGNVLRLRDDTDVDAALAGPLQPAWLPYLSDEQTDFRPLTSSDLRIRLTIPLKGRSGPVFGFVDAIDEPVDFDAGPPGGMRGLIRLSAQISDRGDSGAPALDAAGRLVGFVIGAAHGHTYLISAKKAHDGIVET